MIVDHLDDLEEIVLLELLQRVGNLLKVVLLRGCLLAGETLLLGAYVVVGRKRSQLPKLLLESLRRVLKRNGQDHFVLVLLEVEIVLQGELGLLRVVAVDGHLELSPTFIAARKGRVVECWSGVKGDISRAAD